MWCRNAEERFPLGDRNSFASKKSCRSSGRRSKRRFHRREDPASATRSWACPSSHDHVRGQHQRRIKHDEGVSGQWPSFCSEQDMPASHIAACEMIAVRIRTR
jgi:hypothetical protein